MKKKYINPDFKKGAFAQKEIIVDVLAKGVIARNIASISRAITLVESELSRDREKASQLLSLLDNHKSQSHSIRIAISGSPGVGKSTFIESLVKKNDSSTMAILTVDPSSSESHGSILGDKTRMETLMTSDHVYVRPSPAGSTLGGVTHATREAIRICEAAGFDKIIVETVGVGQSETAVSKMVDFFILLILPGSGDEVQGIKRGIVELADLVLITKNDGDRKSIAQESRRAYKNALHLFRQRYPNWVTPVYSCSAIEDTNIDKVWETINAFEQFAKKDSWIQAHRAQQDTFWYNDSIRMIAFQNFLSLDANKRLLEKHRKLISEGNSQVWKLLEEFKPPS